MPTSLRIPKKGNISHRADVGIRPYINLTQKGLTIFSVSPFCVKNSVYFAGSFLDTAVVSLPFSEAIFSACMPRMTTPPMRKNTMLKVSRLIAA